LEISKIRDFDKKSKFLSLTNIISETIVDSAAIQKRAMELQQIETIRKIDSLHLASAESGLAVFFSALMINYSKLVAEYKSGCMYK